MFKRLRLPDVIGTPTLGEVCGPWFFPIVAALFGVYDPATNIRHISEVFPANPEGQRQSRANGGAVMLTAIIVNRRPEAEFLFIAPTMEIAGDRLQAGQGHDPARSGADQDCSMFRIISARSRIGSRARRCRSRRPTPTSSRASKATGTMIDETHVFAKKSNAAEVFIELRGALTKRPDGFLFQTTTQSKQPPTGVFASELAMARSGARRQDADAAAAGAVRAARSVGARRRLEGPALLAAGQSEPGALDQRGLPRARGDAGRGRWAGGGGADRDRSISTCRSG